MDNKLLRCVRCRGMKKLYKVGPVYCTTNTGGILVVCPMCNGEGSIKALEDALKDTEVLKKKSKKKSSTEL